MLSFFLYYRLLILKKSVFFILSPDLNLQRMTAICLITSIVYFTGIIIDFLDFDFNNYFWLLL